MEDHHLSTTEEMENPLETFELEEEDEDINVVRTTFANPVVMETLMSFCYSNSKSSFLPLRLVSSDFNLAVLSAIVRAGAPALDVRNVVQSAWNEDGMLEGVEALEPRICSNLTVDFDTTGFSDWDQMTAHQDNLVSTFLQICQLKGPEGGGIRRVQLLKVERRHLSTLMEGIQRSCPELSHLRLVTRGRRRKRAHIQGGNIQAFAFGRAPKLVSLDISGALTPLNKSVSKGLVLGAVNLRQLKIDGDIFLELKDVTEFLQLRELVLRGPVDIVDLLSTLAQKRSPNLGTLMLPQALVNYASAQRLFELIVSFTCTNVRLPAAKNLEFVGHFPRLQHSGSILQLHTVFPRLTRISIMDYDLGALMKPGENVDPGILAAFAKLSLWSGTLIELEIKFEEKHQFSLRHLEQILTAMGPSLFLNGLQKLKIYGSRGPTDRGFGFIGRAYERLFSILLCMRDVGEVVFQDIPPPTGTTGGDRRLMEFLEGNGLFNIKANYWFPQDPTPPRRRPVWAVQ